RARLTIEPASGEPVDRSGGADEAKRTDDRTLAAGWAKRQAKCTRVDRVAQHPVPGVGGYGRSAKQHPAREHLTKAEGENGVARRLAVAKPEEARQASRSHYLERAEREAEIAEAEADLLVIHDNFLASRARKNGWTDGLFRS